MANVMVLTIFLWLSFYFTVADDSLCLAGLSFLFKKSDTLLKNNDQQTMEIIAEINVLTMDTNIFSYFCFCGGGDVQKWHL
jgi:hypothetical protein